MSNEPKLTKPGFERSPNDPEVEERRKFRVNVETMAQKKVRHVSC